MNNRKLHICIFLASLMIASIACNFPGLGSQAVQPTETVPVSTDAVQVLEDNLQSAIATAVHGGKVNLSITEAQLTSLVALELQNIEEPRVENLQIRLRDGQITTLAQITINGIAMDLSLISKVVLGPDNLPKTETVEAKLGPLPLPEEIVNLFTQEIDSLLAEQLVFQGQQFFVESLNISDGVMLVTGYLK